MPVLLAHVIEDSTDIFGISGGLNPPNPLGTPLTWRELVREWTAALCWGELENKLLPCVGVS